MTPPDTPLCLHVGKGVRVKRKRAQMWVQHRCGQVGGLRVCRWTGPSGPDRFRVMGRNIRAADICGVFCGSEAVAAGVLTPDQLRGPSFRRLYRDVYLPAAMPVTHPCAARALHSSYQKLR